MNTLSRKLRTSRDEWNDWVALSYSKLIGAARMIHTDATDLVHHTYLRVERQDLSKVMQNPMGYFRRAMFVEATRGQFKKIYQLRDAPFHTHVSDYDISFAIMREELEIMTNHLNWFDRCTLQLYLDGWNLTQISRESGINVSVFHTSLHRSRKKLKNVLSK